MRTVFLSLPQPAQSLVQCFVVMAGLQSIFKHVPNSEVLYMNYVFILTKDLCCAVFFKSPLVSAVVGEETKAQEFSDLPRVIQWVSSRTRFQITVS